MTARALGIQEARGTANSTGPTTLGALLQLKRVGVRHATARTRPRTRNGTGDYTDFEDAALAVDEEAGLLHFL